MANTSNYTYRMDSELRAQSEALFSALGMNLGTAINVFLRKAVRVGGFPFEVTLDAPDTPNKETIEAMLEAERIAKDPNTKKYTIDAAFEELDK
ncbi:MAG: type II toxin-antitoxin system RelB/DinJ family antitoxin [Lachnospiraceae bacterium]|nr:type II toxin-antitoxin system RelB/DinJ family antitoxin [Lachnospiraceae bacterium]